jgi:hypothetical protein
VFKDGIRIVTEKGTSSRYFSAAETKEIFTLGPAGNYFKRAGVANLITGVVLSDKSLVMERLWQSYGSETLEIEGTHGELPGVLGYSRHDKLYDEGKPKDSGSSKPVSTKASAAATNHQVSKYMMTENMRPVDSNIQEVSYDNSIKEKSKVGVSTSSRNQISFVELMDKISDLTISSTPTPSKLLSLAQQPEAVRTAKVHEVIDLCEEEKVLAAPKFIYNLEDEEDTTLNVIAATEIDEDEEADLPMAIASTAKPIQTSTRQNNRAIICSDDEDDDFQPVHRLQKAHHSSTRVILDDNDDCVSQGETPPTCTEMNWQQSEESAETMEDEGSDNRILLVDILPLETNDNLFHEETSVVGLEDMNSQTASQFRLSLLESDSDSDNEAEDGVSSEEDHDEGDLEPSGDNGNEITEGDMDDVCEDLSGVDCMDSHLEQQSKLVAEQCFEPNDQQVGSSDVISAQIVPTTRANLTEMDNDEAPEFSAEAVNDLEPSHTNRFLDDLESESDDELKMNSGYGPDNINAEHELIDMSTLAVATAASKRPCADEVAMESSVDVEPVEERASSSISPSAGLVEETILDLSLHERQDQIQSECVNTSQFIIDLEDDDDEDDDSNHEDSDDDDAVESDNDDDDEDTQSIELEELMTRLNTSCGNALGGNENALDNYCKPVTDVNTSQFLDFLESSDDEDENQDENCVHHESSIQASIDDDTTRVNVNIGLPEETTVSADISAMNLSSRTSFSSPEVVGGSAEDTLVLENDQTFEDDVLLVASPVNSSFVSRRDKGRSIRSVCKPRCSSQVINLVEEEEDFPEFEDF